MRRTRLAALTASAILATGAVSGIVAGCGGGAGSSVTPGATTPPTDTSDPLSRGKAVFLGISGCGGCHTLADAGSVGTVASNLDEKKPDAARVQDVLVHGSGAMPSYEKQLSAQEIADVAAYVASVAGR